jgi:hypothetical protein
VLPAHLDTGDVIDYVVRELDWVLDRLGIRGLSEAAG